MEEKVIVFLVWGFLFSGTYKKFQIIIKIGSRRLNLLIPKFILYVWRGFRGVPFPFFATNKATNKCFLLPLGTSPIWSSLVFFAFLGMVPHSSPSVQNWLLSSLMNEVSLWEFLLCFVLFIRLLQLYSGTLTIILMHMNGSFLHIGTALATSSVSSSLLNMNSHIFPKFFFKYIKPNGSLTPFSLCLDSYSDKTCSLPSPRIEPRH